MDEHVDVRLKRCPDCGGGHLSACQHFEDHYQEDIVIPRATVRLRLVAKPEKLAADLLARMNLRIPTRPKTVQNAVEKIGCQ